MSGDQIAPDFALSGQLTDSGELTTADQLSPAETLQKFDNYADSLGLAAIPESTIDDASLRDAVVLGEVELFVKPQTVTVRSVDDLLHLAVASKRPAELLQAMELFAEIEQLEDLAGQLGNSFVREKLLQVVELWPSHLSAQMLLLAGDAEKRPSLLSSSGSVRAVNSALAPLRDTYEADLAMGSNPFDVDELVAETRYRLQSVDGKLSSEVRGYRLAAEDLVVMFKDYLSLNNRDADNANAEQHRRALNDRLRSLELMSPTTG